MGTRPLSSDLNLLAIWKRMAERASTDSVSRLDDDDTQLLSFQITSCRQARKPCSDHYDIHFAGSHRAPLVTEPSHVLPGNGVSLGGRWPVRCRLGDFCR